MSATSPTSPSSSTALGELKSPSEAEPAVAEANQDAFALNTQRFYDEELNLDSVATIQQRLAQVELQPEVRRSFHPMSHMLSVKRSLRCKECDHNLSKPEYNPSSIKFKILLAGYYHIPEVRLMKLPTNLEPGQDVSLELTLQNPAPYKLNITLIPSDDPDDGTNCDISLPQTDIVIPPKDDTLDIDVDILSDKRTAGASGSSRAKDDPSLVTFRRGNKIGLILPVTMRHDTAGSPRVAFYMKHDFVNSVVAVSSGITGDKREQVLRFVTHKLILTLGNQ